MMTMAKNIQSLAGFGLAGLVARPSLPVASPLPTGSATGSEVEDVLVQVDTYAVLAAHSTSCRPTVSGDIAAVSDPDCTTSHTVSGLADTGSNILLPLVLSGSLLAAAGATWYFGRKGRWASTSQQ